jgi:hypothetical protein
MDLSATVTSYLRRAAGLDPAKPFVDGRFAGDLFQTG